MFIIQNAYMFMYVHLISFRLITQFTNCRWLVVPHGQSISFDDSLSMSGLICANWKLPNSMLDKRLLQLRIILIYPKYICTHLLKTSMMPQELTRQEVRFPGGTVSFWLWCYLFGSWHQSGVAARHRSSHASAGLSLLSVSKQFNLPTGLVPEVITFSLKTSRVRSVQ